MAATTGLTGQVTSHTGTFNAAMLALLKPASFTLDTSAAELDTTGYAAGTAAVRSAIKGLRRLSGQYSGYLATPGNGILGAVSGTAYSTNVRNWSMSLRADAVEANGWPIATGGWEAFVPGLVQWGGSYEAIVDGTTPVTFAGDTTEPLTGTFTVTTGQTLAGSLFVTGANVVSRVGELQVVRYTYRGTGHVTSVGSANIIPAASTIATPVAGVLTLQAASSRTYSGSAFWTGIEIVVNPAAVSQATVNFQMTGQPSIDGTPVP